MSTTLAILGLLAVALGGWSLFRNRPGRKFGAIALAAGIGLCAIAWGIRPAADAQAPNAGAKPPAAQTPASFLPKTLEPEFGFVGSQACESCHPQQHASWYKTYHRTMTQPATLETVVAKIPEEPLFVDGREYQFQRRDDGYWVDMINPDWDAGRTRAGHEHEPLPSNAPRSRRPIVMTTGSHNKQSYWVPSSVGDYLVRFPLTWRIDDQRWVPLNRDYLHPPNTPTPHGIWDTNCFQCHSVAGQPRRNPGTYADSHVAELGIACEACHGPGAKHVQAAQDAAQRKASGGDGAFALAIVNPREIPHDRSSQVCGQCHAYFGAKNLDEWRLHGDQFHAGNDLAENRNLLEYTEKPTDPRLIKLLADDPYFFTSRFWADGTCRVTGREYTAQMLSPCYQKGEMSCLSCHSMHSYQDRVDLLGQGMETNQACLQCHPKYAENLSSHTHHAEGSSGSLCYNCHMPHTTYGLFKLIRTHRVDSPSVANSVKTGRPNACNLCHLDQTHEWSANKLTEWYQQPAVELSDEDRLLSASVAMFLRGDAAQRATIAWHFGWRPAQEASGADWLAPLLAVHLDDPYHAIRNVARKSLQALPGFEAFEYDYIGPEADRKAAVTRAFDLWTKQGHAPPTHAPQVLFNASGQLDQPAVDKLRAQRDDTPIYIAE